MRMFAKISEKYDKTEYDKKLMKDICLLSEIIDFEYVQKMGNL